MVGSQYSNGSFKGGAITTKREGENEGVKKRAAFDKINWNIQATWFLPLG